MFSIGSKIKINFSTKGSISLNETVDSYVYTCDYSFWNGPHANNLEIIDLISNTLIINQFYHKL